MKTLISDIFDFIWIIFKNVGIVGLYSLGMAWLFVSIGDFILVPFALTGIYAVTVMVRRGRIRATCKKKDV